MLKNAYRPTSGRAIILGIIAFIILISIFCGLAGVLKILGAPFMFLPQQFGFIPKVTRADVYSYEMRQSPVNETFDRVGEYAVYTGDIDLLLITDQLLAAEGNPWINVVNTNNGEKIPVDFVRRGLIPFDSPLADGRPVYIFEIKEPGTYQLSFPRRYATVFILPNNIVGYESPILVFTIIQLIILAYPISILIRKMIRKRQQKLAEIRGLKKSSDQEFWHTLDEQRQRQMGHTKTDED